MEKQLRFKIALIIAVLFFVYPTQSQTIKFEVSKISIQNGTKDALYLKAKTWVVNTFVSAKDVIQMDDKALGRLIVKGKIAANDTNPNKMAKGCKDGYLDFTLTIDVKLNKSRISFTDVYHTGMEVACDIGSDKTFDYKSLDQVITNDADYNSLKSNAKLDFQNLISSFEKALKSNPKADNW